VAGWSSAWCRAQTVLTSSGISRLAIGLDWRRTSTVSPWLTSYFLRAGELASLQAVLRAVDEVREVRASAAAEAFRQIVLSGVGRDRGGFVRALPAFVAGLVVPALSDHVARTSVMVSIMLRREFASMAGAERWDS